MQRPVGVNGSAGGPTRRQLTFFVPRQAADALEAVRRMLDPVQFRLIPAHVTLCRENEIAGLTGPRIRQRVLEPGSGLVTLRFGPAEHFSGHGILLPCIGGEDAFRALRQHVLGIESPREQRPHITLAHPRNTRAPGNSLSAARALPASIEITFSTVALIQQAGANPWVVLEAFPLAL